VLLEKHAGAKKARAAFANSLWQQPLGSNCSGFEMLFLQAVQFKFKSRLKRQSRGGFSLEIWFHLFWGKSSVNSSVPFSSLRLLRALIKKYFLPFVEEFGNPLKLIKGLVIIPLYAILVRNRHISKSL